MFSILSAKVKPDRVFFSLDSIHFLSENMTELIIKLPEIISPISVFYSDQPDRKVNWTCP